MVFQCWASIEDGGTTMKHHWVNVTCLLGNSLHTNVSQKIIAISSIENKGTGSA